MVGKIIKCNIFTKYFDIKDYEKLSQKIIHTFLIKICKN